jgi:hypothetical protein
MSEQLNARNIRALADAAQADRQKADGTATRIAALERMVAMLSTEVQTLRGQVAVLLAGRGGGPTARS